MDAGVKFIHAAYGFGTIEDKVPEIHKFCELENVADQVLLQIRGYYAGAERTGKANELLRWLQSKTMRD